MITKDQLAELRSRRATPDEKLEYHIDGPIRAAVTSSVHAELEREILLGDRALQDAHDHMQQDQVFSSLDGLSKAHFNNAEVKTTLEGEQAEEALEAERAYQDAQKSMQIEHAVSQHEGQPTEFFNQSSKPDINHGH